MAETGSTNADMLEWAAHGARSGDWLVAERQTAGRGRLGRAWESPAGNIHASTLIRLRDDDPPAATLSLVVAIAAHRALLDMFPPAIETAPLRIKWPNDILYGNAKIAGILLEREKQAVVAGFGINVAHAPPHTGRPTTSLAAIRGPKTLHLEFTVRTTLGGAIRTVLEQWRAASGLAAIRTEWLQRAHPVGTPLSVILPDGSALAGHFDGLSDDCALILRLADGSVRAIHTGDVFQV